MTFYELYEDLVSQAVKSENKGKIPISSEYDKNQLDCLLYPKKKPVIWKFDKCECDEDQQEKCANGCSFSAITPNQEGGIRINDSLCVGCSSCVENCKEKKLITSRDVVAV